MRSRVTVLVNVDGTPHTYRTGYHKENPNHLDEPVPGAINNPNLDGHFKIGKAYYFDITEAQ